MYLKRKSKHWLNEYSSESVHDILQFLSSTKNNCFFSLLQCYFLLSCVPNSAPVKWAYLLDAAGVEGETRICWQVLMVSRGWKSTAATPPTAAPLTACATSRTADRKAALGSVMVTKRREHGQRKLKIRHTHTHTPSNGQNGQQNLSFARVNQLQ